MGRLAWLALAIPLLAGVLGCADAGKPKYPVSGTVTFDGAPVEDGHILFIPDPPTSAVEGGPIEDGKYQFDATPGKKRVEITATRADPKRKNPMGEPVPVDYIPPKYNLKTTLTADVSASGKNEVNFTLTSR